MNDYDGLSERATLIFAIGLLLGAVAALFTVSFLMGV